MRTNGFVVVVVSFVHFDFIFSLLSIYAIYIRLSNLNRIISNCIQNLPLNEIKSTRTVDVSKIK